MAANITFPFLPSVDPARGSNATQNGTRSPSNSSYIPEDYYYYYYYYNLEWIVLFSIEIIVCLFGMAGNGTVIWILGCYMKGNSFTTYILNLSVADFALLTVIVMESACWVLNILRIMDYSYFLKLLLNNLFLFTFSTSQFLLAAISLDRCVCLFFPLWHKCRWPTHLSTAVCFAIWTLTFLIFAFQFALFFSVEYAEFWYNQYLLNAVLCMPTISISTTAMLVKVCFMSPHHRRGKILKAILLALLFFLFFGFPLNSAQLFFLYGIPVPFYFDLYASIGASLNSAINPFIYFLVGRDKKAQSRGKIKKMFEKLFQEEELCREEIESTPLETHLRSL